MSDEEKEKYQVARDVDVNTDPRPRDEIRKDSKRKKDKR